MYKTEGMKEWKQKNRDRKKLLSSPNWFDELPMQAVVMPDAMILPDLGQPASYYAILRNTHTHTNQLHQAGQVTYSLTENLESVCAIHLTKMKQEICPYFID